MGVWEGFETGLFLVKGFREDVVLIASWSLRWRPLGRCDQVEADPDFDHLPYPSNLVPLSSLFLVCVKGFRRTEV